MYKHQYSNRSSVSARSSITFKVAEESPHGEVRMHQQKPREYLGVKLQLFQPKWTTVDK